MAAEYVEISTKQGKLKGLVQKSVWSHEKLYYSFQGIPYAKPPIGSLRFKVSVPFGLWEGVRDATKAGNDSLQKHMLFKDLQVGDEDCLYLNVYTTQLRSGSPNKAVMVWIHGGAFAKGSGSAELYGPDFLIEEEVVIVSINYRCGAFGFLSLENDTLPGNLGLKDQTLALRWVQENIESFGGNPNNVTIFGESAGAASVNYHLLSPLSRGLFHKAILQSGFSVCHQWAFQNKPKDKALLFAKKLGCTSEDADEIHEFLMSVPADDILKAQEDSTLLNEKEKVPTFSQLFLPCIEVSGDEPFLSDYPRNLMEKGYFAKVPIIMGVVDQEGLLALAVGQINCDRVNENLSLLVPKNLNIKSSREEHKLGKEILKFYTNTEVLSWDVLHGYIDYISDIKFTIGLDISRECFLKNNTESVYTYQFSYVSPRCYSHFTILAAYPDRATKFVGYGASHGDELALLFKTNLIQVPYTPPTVEDEIFMNKFLKAWTTFAKTGSPNCKELGVTWKPDTLQTPHYLDMGQVWRTADSTLFSKRMEFWRKIYDKYSYIY